MDQHRLLTFVKLAARFGLWVLWSIVWSFTRYLAVLALAFYFWASFGRPDDPHPHSLNWPEYKAVFFDASNHVMSKVYAEYAGGCGQ